MTATVNSRTTLHHGRVFSLIKENVTLEHVTFGPGGEAGPLKGHGLGVEISPQNLEGLSNPSNRVIVMRP